MDKVTPEIKRFVSFVKADCKKHKVKFQFSKERFVITGNTKCNGFFNAEKKILAVAGGQPIEKWLRILAHEYGHMTQWKDQTKIWKEIDGTGYDSEELLEAWVDKVVELNKRQLVDLTTRARNVEWECEKRTIRLIKEFKLPLDTKVYAKTANAYVYFWTYQMLVRHWYVIGNEPYNNQNIVNVMPTHLNLDHSKMSAKLKALYKKELKF